MPSQEKLRELFEYRDGDLYWRNKLSAHSFTDRPAGCVAKCKGGVYRQIRIKGRLYQAHRLVWVFMNGDMNQDVFIDHQDHNGLNNNIDNLRLASHGQNQRNQRRSKTNTSGVTGVVRDKRGARWIGQMNFRVNGVSKIIRQSFPTFEEAVAYRKRLELEYLYHPNHGA